MSVIVYDVTFGALNIKQASSVEASMNVQVVSDYASGGVSPEANFVMSAEPRARFSTMDLETVLAGIDEVGGLSVAAGNIYLPWRVRASGGSVVSGANNIRFAATHGLLLPQSISVAQDGEASLELEAMLYSSNGTTAPVTYAGSQSLSAPGFTGTFRLGPTSLNSGSATGIVGYTVNFGITSEFERTDGNPYATAAYVTRAIPTIDIRFRNHTLLSTYGPMFANGSAAVLSLVKNAPGGTIVALTEEEHITITLGDSVFSVQSVGAQGVSIAEPTLRITGKTLTIATGAALA